MALDYQDIYDRLYAYCEAEGFAGHDPFDGLNSVLFQLTPLKHIRVARLAWLQMMKRSPVDLRSPLRVKRGVNPKGLALFALAELSQFRASGETRHAGTVKQLLSQLLDRKIEVGPTIGFGYNFDWQSRHFFAPLGTPAIVPTAFAARAFVEAFEEFGDEQYLDAASRICEFIVGSLNRPVEATDEICFSYTPLDNGVIYNASLLAGETLVRVGTITASDEYLELAAKTARFVIRRQRGDGSWTYGEAANQAWVDNFHTAYVLMSLETLGDSISDLKFEMSDLRSKILSCVEKGERYWRENFFLTDGTPKYYNNKVYPIDIHACAVAIIALCQFGRVDLARKTAKWAVENMLDPGNYFYYQVRRNGVVKTPFMRWGQAWIAYALATLIETDRAE